ncbi:MAG: ATP-binding cassette domain-containing protein [Thermaerobacterales bacterium]
MIRVEGLEKRYGSVTALAGADLEVSKGEVFALLGPNGAGKSTLMHILITLLRGDGGRAEVAGFDVFAQADAVRRRIGVTFQEHALDPGITGMEALRDGGALQGMTEQTITRRLAELESLLDMPNSMERLIKTYSGGMKRRLELARALLAEPQVLFLDEPTLGLDPQNRRALWDHVLDLRDRLGMTVFLTTHYIEEAERLADRVAIIDHGRILRQGAPAELISAIGGDVVLLAGEGPADAVAQALTAQDFCQAAELQNGRIVVSVNDGGRCLVDVIQIALEQGFQIQDVQLRRPTLDEVFLQLTGRGLRDG